MNEKRATTSRRGHHLHRAKTAKPSAQEIALADSAALKASKGTMLRQAAGAIVKISKQKLSHLVGKLTFRKLAVGNAPGKTGILDELAKTRATSPKTKFRLGRKDELPVSYTIIEETTFDPASGRTVIAREVREDGAAELVAPMELDITAEVAAAHTRDMARAMKVPTYFPPV